MINLNRKFATKKDILKEVSEIDIYRCYMSSADFEVGRPILSPLREETNASFGFYVGESNEIMFKDFKLGGGDCINFVQLLFKCNFYEAISRIIIDFGLTDKYEYKEINSNYKPPTTKLDKKDIIKKATNKIIRKKKRDWNLRDIAFWNKFGIDLPTLKKYNVEPVSYIFVNDNIIKADPYSYCYIEAKDGVETYKIYQPFNKEYKWINNHNDSVWQGWEQLPKEGLTLILTKSLKDVMTIDHLTGIPAVSLQAESIHPKSKIIEELKSRFENIFIWYDNDFDKETNWGRKYAYQLAEQFGILQLEIPSEYRIKDISDFVKVRGEDEANELINNLITDLPF